MEGITIMEVLTVILLGLILIVNTLLLLEEKPKYIHLLKRKIKNIKFPLTK